MANRYTLMGMVVDAAAGRSVVYVGPRQEVTEILEYARPLAERVRVANGNERVDFRTGGEIRFAHSSQGLRGRTADVVVLAPGLSADESMLGSAAACVRLARGEVIRA